MDPSRHGLAEQGAGAWSPPIPSGRAALQAWKTLARPARRELLRGPNRHPDPAVAAIAVGYARTMQGRHGLLHYGLMNFAAFLPPALAAAVAAALDQDAVMAPLIAVFVAVVIARMFLVSRFRLALVRMENANAPGLLAAQRPAPPQGLLGTGQPLTVRYTMRLYAALRGRRRGQPVLTLDHGGIELVNYPLRVSWPELAEIRVFPIRGLPWRRPARRVIVFVVRDPETAIGRVPARKAKAARRCMNYYGSPIALATLAINHTPDEITAAAHSLGALPVRHFTD